MGMNELLGDSADKCTDFFYLLPCAQYTCPFDYAIECDV